MQATSLCNLDCSYCYVPGRLRSERMSDETLEHVFRVLFASELAPQCRVLWHAGEPMTAGLPFYRRALDVERRHNVTGRPVEHWIQTNGTLVDDEWCRFFRDHGFFVSLSIDGPEFLHDAHRRDWSGRPTFARVMRALELFRSWGIELQVLSVLTRESLPYAKEYFRFFVENGVERVGFNIEELNVQTGRSSMVADAAADREALTGEYKRFVATLFALWKEAHRDIEIRELSETYQTVNEKVKNPRFRRVSEEQVGMDVLSVKRNGDVFTFSPELLEGNDGDPDAFVLGNVAHIVCFEELARTEKYLRIAGEVRAGIERCRRSCAYFDFCGGGHLAAKYFENGTFDCTETEFCKLHRQAIVDVVIDGLAAAS
jgi:uncharacterized protein